MFDLGNVLVDLGNILCILHAMLYYRKVEESEVGWKFGWKSPTVCCIWFRKIRLPALLKNLLEEVFGSKRGIKRYLKRPLSVAKGLVFLGALAWLIAVLKPEYLSAHFIQLQLLAHWPRTMDEMGLAGNFTVIMLPIYWWVLLSPMTPTLPACDSLAIQVYAPQSIYLSMSNQVESTPLMR